MERLEAESLDDLYEEIAQLKGYAERERATAERYEHCRSITFSEIFLVFCETPVATAAVEDTQAWKHHRELMVEIERDAAEKQQREAAARQRQAEARDRAQYERLHAQFGGR